MKTKIAITILLLILSLHFLFGQNITYGDQNETNVALSKSANRNNPTSNDTTTPYYKCDELSPNSFTTGSNIKIVCRLNPDASDTNIICSTTWPENGWGTMVADDENEYSCENKLHNAGANIYSMVFTDPSNGWAVGVMESSFLKSYETD